MLFGRQRNGPEVVVGDPLFPFLRWLEIHKSKLWNEVNVAQNELLNAVAIFGSVSKRRFARLSHICNRGPFLPQIIAWVLFLRTFALNC